MRPLGADDQGEYKRSLLARADVAAEVAEELLAALEERGSKGKVVASGDGEYVYVDLLPREAGKRTAMEYVRDAFAVDPARVVACGDSANDVDMLAGAHNAVCVGNAQPALMEWAKVRARERVCPRGCVWMRIRSCVRGWVRARVFWRAHARPLAPALTPAPRRRRRPRVATPRTRRGCL